MASSDQPVDSSTSQEQIDSYLNTLSEKYLANNAISLSSTTAGLITATAVAIAPYGNLTNRYYPTVAILPETSSNLKTRGELGGYFIPSNLGGSVYLTKNITYKLDISQLQFGVPYTFIDPTRFNKGEGLTQKDQDNIITHYLDLNWMKSVTTSEAFDGNIINADTYQKFIPYQSAFESTKSDSNGVNNARYDFEFWTGPYKSTWDENNSTNKLTELKYFDLQTRIDNLLYTPGQELYAWNTDVFGNQYALYKPLSSTSSLYAAATSIGNLYVKTVDSTINTGTLALSAIYKSYINYGNGSVYAQLQANNLKNFEVFFDTFVVELSSTILYDKVTFNYDNFRIEKSLQNFLPLDIGTTSSRALSTQNLQTYIGTPDANAITFYGGNWYNASEKTITVCTLLSATFTGGVSSLVNTSGLSSIIIPVLYKLDLNNPQERQRVYPTNSTPASAFLEYVYNSTKVGYMEAPVFSYNEDTKLYLTTFIAFENGNQQMRLINYKTSA